MCEVYWRWYVCVSRMVQNRIILREGVEPKFKGKRTESPRIAWMGEVKKEEEKVF